jgi:hypothetical protein
MAKFILVDGDQAIFLPIFDVAIVTVRPGKIEGKGLTTIRDKKVCVVGDEASVQVPGCPYTTPQFSIPGTGTLKISQLASDQQARKTYSGDKAVLLEGGDFKAVFEVNQPAKQPPPPGGSPIPDPMTQYTGSGVFIATNKRFRGC